MAIKYRNVVPVRLTDEDLRRSERMAEQLSILRSILIRQVWCRWLKEQEATEKTAA